MKYFLQISFIFLLSFSASTANAQLPDGSVAPNWILDDISGVQHNMQDYLDQGYTVLMDWSASWCGPCIAYHQTGILDDLYEEYGPNGTQQVVVFLMEGDPATSLDDIYGNDGTSFDWVTGTTYPIIESESYTDAYEIAYWPTLYAVCPSGTVYQVQQVGVDAHIDWIVNNCSATNGSVNASAALFSGEANYCDTYTPSFYLKNLGEDNLTNAELHLKLEGEIVETLDWTGNLAPTQLEEVSFTPIPLSGTNNIVIEIVNPNNTVDEFPQNNMIETTVTESIYSESATIDLLIWTDGKADETTWEITDADGEVIADGGQNYGNLEIYLETIELPGDGCYFFTIFDTFGDGGADHRMKSANGSLLFDEVLYGYERTVGFGVDTSISGIEEIKKESFRVWPNPTNDLLNVRLESTEQQSVQLVLSNFLGQQVQYRSLELVNGTNNLSLNTHTLTNGVYTLSIQTEDGILSQSVVISHP